MSEREASSRASARQWMERLIEDYRDHRWRQLMGPMCDKMERWKAGELDHADMDEAFDECYQKVCEVRSLFRQRQDRLVNLIQWLDREWFEGWVKEHTPPEDIQLNQPSR